MKTTSQRRAIFLDRDGTLNRDVHYLSKVEEFDWIPGAIDGLKALSNAGWALVVITNQSGIAQGKLTHDDLDEIHECMVQDLQKHGVDLDGIYFCPHHPTQGPSPGPCECRKPAPGMLLRAESDLNLDLANSWMIGDSIRDLQAAQELGIPSILVRTGKGASQEPDLENHQNLHALVADDMRQAAEWVLAHTGT